MKKMFLKLSRRERITLLIGLVVLLFGVVVYPAAKKASAYREEQVEAFESDKALLEGLFELYNEEPTIEEENELLRDALSEADDLLFPPIQNPILTQTAMIKLLNELGPDLELEVTSGRSSVGDAANQMNLAVRGTGRYPELLKFLYRLETYRPLILVEEFSLAERGNKRGKRGGRRKRLAALQSGEPNLTLKLSLQIICQTGGEK